MSCPNRSNEYKKVWNDALAIHLLIKLLHWSKGGTSILVTAIAFGIMLSISRTATRQGGKKQDIRDEIEALPEQFGAENQMQL